MPKNDKIYCANCKNCIIMKVPVPNNPKKYMLRVKCAAGVWQKKLGTEKMYKFFTVARRVVPDCDSYAEMGDSNQYLKSLRKTLPAQDDVYDYPNAIDLADFQKDKE